MEENLIEGASVSLNEADIEEIQVTRNDNEEEALGQKEIDEAQRSFEESYAGQIPFSDEGKTIEQQFEGLSQSEKDEIMRTLSDNSVEELERELEEIMPDIGGRSSLNANVDSPKLDASYDTESGEYTYLYPNGCGFKMDAPLGGFAYRNVRVSTLPGTVIRRYALDAVAIPGTGPNGGSMREFTGQDAGSYAFAIEANSRGETDGTRQHYESRGTFRVLQAGESLQTEFLKPPYGFRIGEVKRNGVPEDKESDEYTHLKGDGDYEVTFEPVEISGGVPVRFAFNRDTTPPSIRFSREEVGDGEPGTIFFEPSEPDADVQVFLNGYRVQRKLDGVRAAGNYQIQVSDKYGNSADYYFSIAEHGTTSYELYIALFIFLIVFSVLVVFFARRKLVVR